MFRAALTILIASGAMAFGAAPAEGQVLSPQAFAPTIRVRDAEKPIEVATLKTGVLIHGLHAETTQTVTFYNPNGRVLEGELEFPLPDGATVSGFGFDVEGQLVDGVVVQKDRARVILETEIRHGIDPGLVEQVRGNVYRTRIYPIPARGTRTVRLTWVNDLTTRGTDAAYHLPLPYDRPIGEVSLRVEVVRPQVTPEVSGGFGNLVLRHAEDRWVAEASWRNAAPTTDLLVRLPHLPEQLVDLEPGDGAETFFSVSTIVPTAGPGGPTAIPAPRRIAVAWDSSGSRTPEATERELAFLSGLLSTWPAVPVDLVVFRDRPEGVVTFSTSDGGKRLVSTLRAAAVDGGTAFASLDLSRAALPRAEDDLWLVFSDGLGTLGEALPHAGGVPVWTITGASLADRALLRHLSQSNGAQLLDLVAMDSRDAVSALTHPQAGLRATVVSPGEAVADLQLVPGADRSRVALTGRLLAPRAEVTLDFGQGRTETVTLRRDAATRASDSNGPVAIAWANGRAETLSLFADRNADELLRLGRRFGLVTANTSLLVLETLAQHLQYGVEPAASRPELLRQYRAQVAANDQATRAQTKDHLEEVVALWSARIQWWEQDFHVAPGFRFHEDEESHGYGGAAAPPARGVVSFGSVTHESSFARSQADFAPPPSPSPVASEQAESKPEAKAGGESNEASIVIKPWDPEVPYLVPLRRAAPRAAYAAYLAERAQYASPAFFLDAAGFLLHAGEKELGLRVLSNLAELRLDDPPLLRVLAWRLSQAGELDLAASVLEKVLRLRPEEPQSLRDLALVLADRAETPAARPDDGQRAVNLLQDVVDRRWDRFPEIELIALMELNRILARAERRGAPLDAHRLDGRLHKLLDVDLRVSLAWDADLTDVDLHLFEPTGEHAFYSHNRTTIGGLVSRDFTQGYGPEEYLVRHAVAGVYAVKAHYYGSRQQTLIGPTTLTATVFTHWGRADEKRQLLTLRLDDIKEMEDIGEVTIGGGHELAKVQSTRRTVAQFRGIRRGMSLDEVKALVGQPDSIADAGELHYRLDDAGEVRVALRGEAGVASVLHVRRGAELELLP